MIYECNKNLKADRRTWEGEIQLISETDGSYEAIINARGTSFHVITGKCRTGMYLCIPNHGIGCGIAEYRDVFWNKEQLSRYLNPIDTESVARGLSLLPEL